MKLIQYTTRLFFKACLIILVPACIILFFAMRKVFREEMDDNLRNTMTAVVSQLPELLLKDQHSDLLGDKIFVSPAQVSGPETFSDTLLLIPDEDELEPFRMYGFFTTYEGQNYHVRICRKQIESKDLVQNIAIWVLVIPAILLFIALFWIRKRSDDMWAPFYQTLNGMRAFSLEQGRPLQIADTSIDEFEELGMTIRDMQSQMLRVFGNVRQFTGNASHEIQTPIAIMLSKIDLLSQKTLSEEVLVELASIRAAAQRLSRLNESLLMLSRLDNRQYVETELVEIHKLLNHHLSSIAMVIEERDLKLTTTITSDTVNANATLVDSLLSNLLMNAVRHNIPGGILQISLDRGILEIRNSGHAPTKSTEELKQRFAKSDAHAQSIGLGLAIVTEICALYGWHFSYFYTNNLHVARVDFENGSRLQKISKVHL